MLSQKGGKMITNIGLVAGDIWNCLEKRGGNAPLKDLMKCLGKSSALVYMSIGWLAREGHIQLDGDEDNYTIKLITK